MDIFNSFDTIDLDKKLQFRSLTPIDVNDLGGVSEKQKEYEHATELIVSGECESIREGILILSRLAVFRESDKFIEKGLERIFEELPDSKNKVDELKTREDFSSNLDYLIYMAEKGDAESQYNLAERYFEGNEVEKDYKEAAKWYLLAADQGNENANAALDMIAKVREFIDRMSKFI